MTTPYAHPESLVETKWLAGQLAAKNIRIVDLRDPEQYALGHIPGAVNLARKDIRNYETPPTFLYPTEHFEKQMELRGISNDTRIVAYDDWGYDQTWLWWMLRYYGHNNMAVLNGGWTKWTVENLPTFPETPKVTPARFKATVQPKWLVTADEVMGAIGKPGVRVIDARTPGEYDGSAKAKYGSERGGHIPSATWLFWEELTDPATMTLRSADEIKKLVDDRKLLRSEKIISYCQAGMRSSFDLFALHLIGYDNLALYHGSWAEWDKRKDLPLETGPAVAGN
jgi:thiosulfate/3-mercaptopyruvate sulfurtransferase